MPRERLLLSLLLLCMIKNATFETAVESSADHTPHLLFEVANDVLKLHENVDEDDDRKQTPIDFGPTDDEDEHSTSKRSVPFPLGKIPTIDVEMDRFRHGYIPFTGFGNREEMSIQTVIEKEVFIEPKSPIMSWHYSRFNSSDFVMLHSKHEIHVWQKMFTDDEKRLHFDLRHSLCSVGEINDGEILMALFYTRTDNFVETLHFAYIVRSPNGGYKLHNYEVSMDHCKYSTVNELDNRQPLALRFVETHHESSLFILYNEINEKPIIKCINCRRKSDIKLVDVSVAYAIDLEVFDMNGDVYAAVAHRSGVDVFYVFGEESNWMDSKRIPDVTDLVTFRVGFKHFLGIATKTGPQHLMLLNEERLVEKQTFDFPEVMQWSAIHMSTCREDVILMFYRHKAPIAVYVWNGNTDQFEMRQPIVHDYNVVPFTQTNIIYNSIANLLQVDVNGKARAIEIHTKLAPIDDPVFVTQNRITNILRLISDRFAEQKNVMERMKEVVRHAVRDPGNGNLLILVKQEFKTIQAKKSAILHQVNNLKKAIWEKSALNLEDFQQFQLSKLRDGFDELKKAIHDIRHQLDHNVVYKNRPSTINGKVTFKGHVESRVINANELHVDRVVNQPLSPVLNNVFHVGRSKGIINGTKTFINPIRVNGNLNALSINGLRFSKDVVLSDRPNKIRGALRMGSVDVKSHLNIKGKLNDLVVPNDLIFLRGKKYTIPAPKTFIDPVTVIDSLSANYVDGVNIPTLPKTVLMQYGNQHVSSPIIVEQPVYMRNIHLQRGLNGLNFNNFVNDLVRVDRPTRITGSKRFVNNMFVRNDLVVKESINGLRIPHDLVTVDTPQRITASKSFRGKVTFVGEAEVDKLVNGMAFPNDLIRLDDTRPIKTELVFSDGITVRNDVHVDGLIDGVNIKELDAMALKRDSNRIHGVTLFKGPVFVRGGMDFRGTVNGIDLPGLYNDAIFKDYQHPMEVRIRGRKRFNGDVSIMDELVAQTINSKRLNNYVPTNNKQGVKIDSRMIFNAPVNFTKMMIKNGHFGNVNFPTILKRRLSLNEKGRMVGGQRFERIVVKKLIVKGLVNKLNPETDFVYKGTQQVIKSTKIFNGSVTFDAGLVLKKNLISKRRIQGVDVSHLARNRITLSGDQLVPTSLLFANSTFESIQLKRGNTFNGIDFNRFVQGILYKDGYQIITAPKNFKHVTVAGNVTSDRGINGVSLWYLKNRAMKLYGDQVIGSSGFEDDLIVNGKIIVEGGLVNGVNLGFFAMDAMNKFGPNIMRGKNIFAKGFVVRGNLDTNLLNGFNPSSDLMMKIGGNIMNGKLRFEELVINGDVYMKKRVNGVDLLKLNRQIMKTNRPNVIRGDLLFRQPLFVRKNLYVAGKINGANFTQAMNNGFRVYGDQHIPGSVILQSQSRFLSNIYAERINGVDVKQFLNDIVYINSEEVQLIRAPKHFVNGINVNKDLRQDYGETRVFGPINKVDLMHLANTIVRVDRPAVITGEVVFTNNVYIRSNTGLELLGRINGVNFNDIVLLHKNPGNKPQVIRGLRFNKLVADNNIFISGFVNGINLVKEARDTLLKYGDQYISGNKYAVQDVTLERGAFVGRLNGFHSVKDIVLINENRTISGRWVFQGDVHIQGHLNVAKGLLAEQLHRLSHESMNTNRPLSVTHAITFERVIFEKDVHVASLINGVNMTHFTAEFDAFKHNVEKRIDRIRKLTVDNFLETDRLLKIYKRPNCGLDSFILFQELNNVKGTIFESHGKLSFAVSKLNRAKDKATVHSFRFNKHMQIFEETSVATGQKYVKKMTFKFSGRDYTIYQSAPNNRSASVLEENNSLKSLLAMNVDEIVYVKSRNRKEVMIASYSGMNSEVVIGLLQKVGDKVEYIKLATLVVGPEANKIAVFEIEDTYFVAVARSFERSCPTTDTGSLIFEWQNREHFQLIQRMPIQANDVLFYSNNHQHYLVFSDVTPMDESKLTPGILVYRYKPDDNGCPFKLFQKLEFNNLNSMTTFSYGPEERPELFLAAVNGSALQVWRQDGQSGFTQSWPMRVVDGHSVEAVSVEKRLFLFVCQRKENTGLFIFEAVTRGHCRSPSRLETWFNVIGRS